MPPRTNPLREKTELKDFLAALYNTDKGFDEESKAAQHIPPSRQVLAATRKQFRDADDYMLTDAVLRAQAHQMAALFIRRARQAAGLSTLELAKRMGVGLTHLSEAQSFKSLRKVPLDFLLRVAYHCGGDLSLVLDTGAQDVRTRREGIERAKTEIKGLERK